MAEFGSGIFLNPGDKPGFDWDFDVDETGDLRSVNGIDELGKDVAFAHAAVLDEEGIGGPLRPITLARIHSIVKDLLQGEVRIQTINNIEVDEGDNPNEVVVRALVQTDDTEQELVFTEQVSP